MRNFSMRARSSSRPAPGEHVGEDRRVVGHGVAAGVLREVAGGVGPADAAGPRAVGAPEHPQERGLAGAVAPDQADLLARTHLQGHAVDDPLARRPRPPGHERSARERTPGNSRAGTIHSRARGTPISRPSLIDAMPTDGADASPTEAHVAGSDPPRRVRGVDPGRPRARAAEPGRVGARRRRASSRCRSRACSGSAPPTTPATGRRTCGPGCGAWTTR